MARLAPSWNVAPTADCAVVRRHPETGARHRDLPKWGLLAYWTKEPSEVDQEVTHLRSARRRSYTPSRYGSSNLVPLPPGITILSFSIFSWSNGTETSLLPMPRKPPTEITAVPALWSL